MVSFFGFHLFGLCPRERILGGYGSSCWFTYSCKSQIKHSANQGSGLVGYCFCILPIFDFQWDGNRLHWIVKYKNYLFPSPGLGLWIASHESSSNGGFLNSSHDVSRVSIEIAQFFLSAILWTANPWQGGSRDAGARQRFQY